MCNDLLVLTIFYIINILITIIKVIIPLLVIVNSVFDMGKSVINYSYDNLIGSVKHIGFRIIAAALIFFLPTIITSIFSMVDTAFATEGISCLMTVTSSDINRIKLENAEKSLEAYEEKLTPANYSEANYSISLLDKGDVKDAFKKRLSESKAIYDKNIKDNSSSNMATYLSSVTTVNNYQSDGKINSPLNLPYYSQYSSAYKSISTSVGTYNTASCGCGYTSLSMVIDGLVQTTLTPTKVVQKLYPSAHNISSCAIPDSTLNSDILKDMGVSSKVLFPRVNFPSTSQMDDRKQLIVSSLQGGHAIVLLIPGHYIALGGINGNKITVLDPANSSNNGDYTVDELDNKYHNYSNRCTSSYQCGFVYAVEYLKA